jgi:serine protease Do
MRRWQQWFWGRSGQLVFWAAIILVVWVLMSFQADRPRWWWPFERSRPAVVEAPAGAPAPPPGSLMAVAKSARPAVVNIASAKTVRGPQGPMAPFFSDPFFRFFPGFEPAPRRERSLGSGVIVTRDGYVLTNSHVVDGAQNIRVTLDDRREFKAQLVGSDPKTDLAVLKLPGSGFEVLPLGDSSRVEVAEIVLAIGNPFGLAQTVTMGIVSAVGRANLGIADYEDFIQTDAAINPGNSGGALVGSGGALIGINTAIFTQSGGYMGIGFAVPINMARQVMDQLVTHGRLTRGYLGVTVQELTPAVARGLGLTVTRGILVADVVPNGPATKAGVQRGDAIISIDGKPVEDVGHFRNLVAGAAPGTKAKLTLLREGREQTVEVTTGEAPERTAAATPAAVPGRPASSGVSVEDVTPDVARKLGLPAGLQGVVVIEVLPGGPAAEAGVRPGDVIQEVNRRPVRSAREFARAVAQAGGGDLVVLVNRHGGTMYVVVEPGG